MAIAGIYMLQFKNTAKVYIGQSIDIDNRIRRHISNMTSNKASCKLQDAYNTFGAPIGLILLECPKTELLNDAENLFIKLHDSVENGFNSSYVVTQARYGEGNSNISNRTIATEIVKYTFTLSELPSIKETAKLFNMSYDIVRNIFAGKSYIWISKYYPEEYASMIARYSEKFTKKIQKYSTDTVAKKYKYSEEAILRAFNLYIDNPDMSITEIGTVTGILPGTVSSIGSGYSHKWIKKILPEKYSKINTVVDIRRRLVKAPTEISPKYELVSPSGELHGFSVQAIFAKEQGMTASGLSKLLSGKVDMYKGWVIA